MKKNILFLKLALLLSLLGAFLPETSISMGMEVQNLSSDEAYVVYNTQNGTLTFYADGKRESHNLSFEEVYEIGYEGDTPLWYDTGASSVVIDKSFANFRPTTCRNWFKGYHYEAFEGMEYLNTSYVTDMSSMFKSCTSLITILVGDYWEVPKNSSDNMFSGCTNVTGENGTTYDENHVGGKYAHVDGGSDDPGYLSSEWPDVTKLVSGNGTENLPYLITRTAELDMLSMNVN